MLRSLIEEKEKPQKRRGWLFLILGSFFSGLILVGILLFWPVAEKPVPARVSSFAIPAPPPVVLSDNNVAEPAEADQGPMLAIVVGDLGYDPVRDADWLNVPARVTLAILPFGPSSSTMASSAQDRGHCVILHVPMEPRSAIVDDRMEPYLMRVGMERGEISEMLLRMVQEIPHAVGAMNHMGSAFTTDQESMEYFAEALREREFFFVDGMTAPGSLGLSVSRKVGIPVVRRDIFLDYDPSPAAMRRRWNEAVLLAKKKGSALLICQGRRETLDMLSSLLPEIQKEGVRLVAVTELFDKLPSADGLAREE